MNEVEEQNCFICDKRTSTVSGYIIFENLVPYSNTLLIDLMYRITRIQFNKENTGQDVLCSYCYSLFEQYDLSEHTVTQLRKQICDQIEVKYGKDFINLQFIDIACQTEDLLYNVKENIIDQNIKVETVDSSFNDEVETFKNFEEVPSTSQKSDKLTEEKKSLPYFCKVCKNRFRKCSELKKHLKSHNTVKIYECKVCSNTYMSKAGLHWHVTHKHKDQESTETNSSNFVSLEPSDIVECNIKIENQEQEEVNESGDRVSFEADEDNCYKDSSELSSEEYSPGVKRKKKKKSLSKDTKENTDKKNEKIKEEKHTEDEDSRSSEADEFGSQNESNSIKKKRGRPRKDSTGINTKPYIYPCPQCSKMWRTKSELRTHLVSHSDVRAHVCDICGQAYKKRAALDVHLGMHKGINPFTCTTCGKVFTQKGALTRHLPIHTGEANYQCDLCGKRFIHHTSFSMHVLSHSGLKAYKCEICGLGLMSTSHLKRHMRAHSGEKKYGCSQCGKRFAERYNLAAHERLHFSPGGSRKRIHTCPLCGDSFQRRQKLEEHLSGSHNKIADSDETRKWAGNILNTLQQWPTFQTNVVNVINENSTETNVT